jgi:hypothetical protein
VIYREAHTLLEELTEATLAGTRKDYLAELATVPLLIVDDLGMRKLAHTAAEDPSSWSCGGTSARRRCSRQIDRWMTGGSCSVIPLPSPRCSIGSSIMPTC